MTHDNLEGKKIGSKKKKKGSKKNIFGAIFFLKQIKFLGARRQHMAKGIGLFFTLSFCSSVYSVYLNRGRGFVQGMLNLTYQVLAKGSIRHHLCCYKLTGHDENCYDQKGSEHEQKHDSLQRCRVAKP
jgi:hypothetical protein